MNREPIVIDEVWTEGDHTTVKGTAVDDGTVIDITGATIELIYSFDNRAPAKLTGSVTSGTAGTFSAQFASGIPDHGTLTFEIRITESTANGSGVFTSGEYQVKVKRKKTQAAA